MRNVKKEEVDMLNTQATTTPPLPLPKREEKRLVQGEINQELFDACSEEMTKQSVKIRQIMEYGFAAWLIRVNPKKAAELGLINDERKK